MSSANEEPLFDRLYQDIEGGMEVVHGNCLDCYKTSTNNISRRRIHEHYIYYMPLRDYQRLARTEMHPDRANKNWRRCKLLPAKIPAEPGEGNEPLCLYCEFREMKAPVTMQQFQEIHIKAHRDANGDDMVRYRLYCEGVQQLYAEICEQMNMKPAKR